MTPHTLKSLGMQKVWTGLGERDFAYRGHGYSIEPGTRRYWRLRLLGGDQIATASSIKELLPRLAELLNYVDFDYRRTDAEVLDTAAERAAKVLPPTIAEVIAEDLLNESMRRTNDLGRLLWLADESQALPVLAVEWGLRIDGHEKPRHCTEHAAWLAAPDETPVSRVVGPWQDTTPNPPTERSQADVRD